MLFYPVGVKTRQIVPLKNPTRWDQKFDSKLNTLSHYLNEPSQFDPLVLNEFTNKIRKTKIIP